MINMRTDIPVKEELIDKVKLYLAQINDLCVKVNGTLEELVKDDKLLTKEQIMEYFHMDKIPTGLPKIRVGNKMMALESDVKDYINKRKRV